jgi:hypothetical protein
MNEHPRTLYDREAGRNAEKTTRRQNSFFATRRIGEKSDTAEVEKIREAKGLRVTVDHIELLTTIFLIPVAACVILLTYAGVSMPLSESGEGLMGKGHALAFAVTVGVVAWLAWKHVFALIPRMREGRLTAGSIAGIGVAIFIVLIDAPFSVLALGGPTAVKLSLADTVESYENNVSVVAAQSTTAAQLLPVMRSQEARFVSLADVEVKTGAQSGSKGEGKVSETFRQVSTTLGSLADEIERGIIKANAVQTNVSAALAEMKRRVFITGDIGERSQAVAIASDTIDRLMGEVRQYDYTVSISATLSILDNLVPAQGEAATAFESVQNRELAIIGEMVKPVSASLRDVLGMLETSGDLVRPSRPLDALEAIRVHWVALLPQWIASIFLDLAPLGFLVMQLAARREAAVLDAEARKGANK